MLTFLKPVWHFREFILASILSELRGRFARSRLGAFWFILQPLAQAAIFALVLGTVLSAKLPNLDMAGGYAIYLLSGLACWTLFSEIMVRCLNVFIEFAPVMKKIAFPRLSLPFIVWGGAAINHVLLLLAITVIIALLGHFPSTPWLFLPVAFVVTSMLAFGLGLLLAIFNVFARDVSHIMGVTMQMWFWMTPVVYPLDALPEDLQTIIRINPVTPLVEAYHSAILYGKWPPLETLLWPAGLATVLVALSFFVFQRASAEIVDAL